MDSDTAQGSALFIAPNATVTGDVEIGRDVVILFGAVIRADRDRITIGDESNVQDNAVIHCSAKFPVTIGRAVSIGHAAIVHGCVIEDQVMIGMGAIVMNGATIGSGSIIGAGAVVTEGMQIPANSVVVGVPARVVKETTEAQRDFIAKNAEAYIEIGRGYVNG
jgi:carbonic anhydrase/acetyltransferase-like protein (isoleucine patch superfamily)